MIRAVLDTNVLVSGIGWTGPPQRVLDAALRGEFVLLLSPALLEEAERVLSYSHLKDLPRARVQEALALLPLVAEMVEPEERITVITDDPSDNRVLECALAGEATHIVSGDLHLLALKSFRKILVVDASTFLKKIATR